MARDTLDLDSAVNLPHCRDCSVLLLVMPAPEFVNKYDHLAQRLFDLTTVAVGLFAAFLVVIDVWYNNWELINFMGNAQYLLTPILNHPTLNDVSTSFAFPKEASPAIMSEAGRYQLNAS